MQEPDYKVVWPLGRSLSEPLTLKPRLSDLKGKTICEVSDYSFKAEDILPIVRESLSKQYPGIKFVEYPEFGNTHGAEEAQVIADLPEKLHQHGCDAVISGVGG